MGSINYKNLYSLQDRVLEILFSVEQEFYLTGGTCLSRYYFGKRYSDDLDFFTNQSSRYSFSIKNIKLKLDQYFKILVNVETKDFTRIIIDDLLQLDFVNESTPHYGNVSILKNGTIIDSLENILSNKLTAIIGRDNPKDVFDIFLISKYHSFNWNKILDSAHKKAIFNDDELITKLNSFPIELLGNIKLIDNTFLDNFDKDFPVIVNDVRLATVEN